MAAPANRRSLRILLVDDDHVVRDTVRRMIQHSGHSVAEATNGVSGLRKLDGEHFDLVITDVVMPDMEGLELVRRIRKRSPSPKVIVISGGGYGSPDQYLELARQFGADVALAKPLSLPELDAAINQVLPPAEAPPSRPSGTI